jgi:CO dehydrogenase/acetyl-CoA synthase gamma subunit (corrinoid Fe-S protein)
MVVEAVDFYGMSPEDIVKYLPGKDCGNCGKTDCLGFAKALSEGTVKVEDCPEMEMRMKESLSGALSIKLEVHEADSSMSTVPETLFEINNPGPDSPVLVTGNCAVTIYVLKLIFEKTPNVSAWVVPTETKGFTIDHAVGMRLMTPMTIMKGLTNSAVAMKVSHRNIMIPGLCAGIEKQVEMMTKWKVEVGPRSGFELPAYIVRKAGEQ